jgi:hypothetical protein
MDLSRLKLTAFETIRNINKKIRIIDNFLYNIQIIIHNNLIVMDDNDVL